MLDLHFHFSSGNAPLFRFEVDLRPFCVAQFARPHKEEWRKTQGTAYDMGALVFVNGPEKFRYFFGLGQACVVLVSNRCQRASEVCGIVPLCFPGSDGVAENLADNLVHPVG